MFFFLFFVLIIGLVLGFIFGRLSQPRKVKHSDPVLDKAIELLQSADQNWSVDPGRALAMKESADSFIALRSGTKENPRQITPKSSS